MQPGSRIAEALAAFNGGDLARAREIVEREIGEQPSPQLQHFLGIIHCRQGEPAAGVDWLRRACEARPDDQTYRVMLVRALADCGRAAEAFAIAEPPDGLGDGAAALWQARAEAAEAAGEAAAAAEAWRALGEARPADWRAWANLGRILFKLNEFAEAEQPYLHALEIAPGETAVVHELGSLYERLNRIGDLDRLLDRWLQRGVPRESLAELWAGRELRRGRANEAEELMRLAPPPQDLPRRYRLEVRIAEAVGDPSGAFALATRMNQATEGFEQWRVRSAQYREELRELARAITPGWAAGLLPSEFDARAPRAFLLGFPRSGTTLLDTFLMGHPKVRVIEEKGLLAAAAQAVGPLADLPDCSPARIRRAREVYAQRLALEAGSSFDGLIVDKAPLNLVLAPLIHLLFGRVPIIFTQRHPCDAVLSGFMQSFAPNLGMANFLNIVDAADFYDAAMDVWTASTNVLGLKTHTVVYEELVANPELSLRPVVEFLDLEWDDQLLDHQATAERRGPIFNPSSSQVVEPLSNRASGRWRRYEAQLEPVLPILLPWAERLGYVM